MDQNRGVAPPNPATDIGQVRLLAGDSSFTPLDPPETGYGSYKIFSDAEIQAFLDMAGGSIPRAISLAYGQIAAAWASTGATIKTDDLSYSAKDSIGNWMALSKYWGDLADAADDKAANDMFDLVVVRGEHGFRKPEAAPYNAGPWSEFW